MNLSNNMIIPLLHSPSHSWIVSFITGISPNNSLFKVVEESSNIILCSYRETILLIRDSLSKSTLIVSFSLSFSKCKCLASSSTILFLNTSSSFMSSSYTMVVSSESTIVVSKSIRFFLIKGTRLDYELLF